jgi:hypothetical protein
MTHECHVHRDEFLHRRQVKGNGRLQAPSALFSSEMTVCTRCIMLTHPDVLMEQIISSHGGVCRSYLLH